MRELIKLKRKVHSYFGLNLEFNENVRNFKLNGIWVTHIFKGRYSDYYSRIEELVIKLKNEQPINSSDHGLIDSIFEDIQNFREQILVSIFNYKNLEQYLEYKTTNEDPIILPIPSQSFQEPNPRNPENRENEILDIIADYFNIPFFEDKNEIDNELVKLRFENNSITSEDLDKIYAYGHLVFALEIQIEFLNKLMLLWKEEFSFSNSIVSAEMDYNNPERRPYHIKYNVKKKEVAMLYHFLYEIKWIGDINRPSKKEQTAINVHLDTVGFYKNEDDNYKKIKAINKEFSSLTKKEFKEPSDEIEVINDKTLFLKDLIHLLTKKMEKLESRREILS